MRKPAAWLLCSLLLVALAAPAFAVVWGPMTIEQMQDPNLAPDPTPPDTLGPVLGVITGFDLFPTGFAFYIQNSAGQPWAGVDVFTGSVNKYATQGLRLGDSVAVSGKTQEFAGETEIEGLDNISSTDDVTVTLLSSGNPLPPFHIGTTAELHELPTNPNAEQWEGLLVKVNGPLRICRTNFTGGLGTFRSSLVVDDLVCPTGSLGPCDSMFIDLSTLADPALAPGNVGDIIDFVQGIYNQRSRGYRIQARNAADYGLPAPPTLVRAYFIGLDTLRVQLDRAVTQASAEDEANYQLQSLGSSVDLATQVAPEVVDLRVTEALAVGQLDILEVSGLVSSASGLTMSGTQTSQSVVGVVLPSDGQAPDPAALAGSPCVDQSQYLGQTLTIRGVCTAKLNTQYYLQGVNGTGTLRNGIEVFSPPVPMQVGRQYVVAGVMTEFQGESEVTPMFYVRDEGAAAIPAPVVQTVAVLADTTCDSTTPGLGTQSHITSGEDYEGVRVRVEQVKVIDDPGAGGFFRIVQPNPSWADTIFVENQANLYTYNPEVDHLLNVNGVLRFVQIAGRRLFRIYPNGDSDIEQLGSVGVRPLDPARVDLRAWPNPGHSFNVAFSLPVAGKAKVGIYDLLGREVAVLADRHFEAGVHNLAWDGRRSDGGRAHSGVYFYRLSANGQERVQKFVRLRQ